MTSTSTPSAPASQPARGSRASRGFTLVEILIVVVILAILAAIVVPNFSSAGENTRENSTKMNLFRIRTQIEIFREHHNGQPPALATFAEEMTMASNVDRETAAPGTDGYRFGPYLMAIPINPYFPGNDVSDGDAEASAWYYNEATGEFRANHNATARAEW